ncbi:MAG: sulfatase-like hydrolase/transferase, partial [Planctomycetes bacterium]|nr:sulfatase-like hydrolase/transferase [Planctomycetota bacterium]
MDSSALAQSGDGHRAEPGAASEALRAELVGEFRSAPRPALGGSREPARRRERRADPRAESAARVGGVGLGGVRDDPRAIEQLRAAERRRRASLGAAHPDRDGVEVSRSVLRRVIAASALLACLAHAGFAEGEPGASSASAARPRPNIVLILADDLGYGELGCYGQEKIKTPHLDRLAAEGLRFTQAYSGAPVCAPSRCVLLTGKHTGHAEIRGNREQKDANGKSLEGQHPLSAAALTLPQLFQRAGYATAAFGKWGLGQAGTSGAPNEKGFELFFGVTCQRVAHSYYPRFVWRNGAQELLNEKPVPGHAKRLEGEIRTEDWSSARHLSSAVRDEALRWLAERKEDGRPFFLYLPFLEPHVAMQPERSFVERYPAEWDREPYRGQCGYTPHPRPRAGYAAMISQLDDHVGRIVAALEAQGLAENTLIVFTSDNGTTHEHNGDPVLGVGGVDGEFF